MPLIDIRDLTIRLQTQRGPALAVQGVSFQIERGQALGLIGESGCGKSITAMALMGLLPESAQASGSVRFQDQELLTLSERQWRSLRGNRIAMVFQEPMTALNPVHTIGHQIAEPMRLHQGLSATAARDETIALLARVGIAQPGQRFDAYPHQFSGGQRQRITIAMALACGPDLLIADEPTTALDVTLQRQILELINELVAERNMALLLISHDLGLISQNVDHMLVMYGGRIVESGATADVFEHMAHPYTRGLLAARPGLAPRAAGQPRPRLATIAGTVPELVDLPIGCTFAGRCNFTQPDCYTQVPPAVTLSPEHRVYCLRPQAYAPGHSEAATP